MTTAHPFETHPGAYDDWFDANETAHLTDQAAIERVLPDGSARERASRSASEPSASSLRSVSPSVSISH